MSKNDSPVNLVESYVPNAVAYTNDVVESR